MNALKDLQTTKDTHISCSCNEKIHLMHSELMCARSQEITKQFQEQYHNVVKPYHLDLSEFDHISVHEFLAYLYRGQITDLRISVVRVVTDIFKKYGMLTGLASVAHWMMIYYHYSMKDGENELSTCSYSGPDQSLPVELKRMAINVTPNVQIQCLSSSIELCHSILLLAFSNYFEKMKKLLPSRQIIKVNSPIEYSDFFVFMEVLYCASSMYNDQYRTLAFDRMKSLGLIREEL